MNGYSYASHARSLSAVCRDHGHHAPSWRTQPKVGTRSIIRLSELTVVIKIDIGSHRDDSDVLDDMVVAVIKATGDTTPAFSAALRRAVAPVPAPVRTWSLGGPDPLAVAS